MELRQRAVEALDVTEVAKHEFWCDRPVLITGATGLLGGWINSNNILAQNITLYEQNSTLNISNFNVSGTINTQSGIISILNSTLDIG